VFSISLDPGFLAAIMSIGFVLFYFTALFMEWLLFRRKK
jgi:hypothetical protein